MRRTTPTKTIRDRDFFTLRSFVLTEQRGKQLMATAYFQDFSGKYRCTQVEKTDTEDKQYASSRKFTKKRRHADPPLLHA